MQRLRVSANGRFLVQEDGSPFFWLGDTAWELFHRARWGEIEYYLETRRMQGFNLIQAVILAECDGLRTPNAYGHVPFDNQDPTRPVEAYFQYVDRAVALAALKGLYVGLLPTWGDKVTPDWGAGPVIFDAEKARDYGRFLGARYREAQNIVWILGGDRPGKGYEPIWDALAAGLDEGTEGAALMTFHPGGGMVSSSEVFHNADWLDLNMMQSSHIRQDAPNWEFVGRDYQLSPAKPTLDGEPNYEDHPVNPFTRTWIPEYGYFTDYDVRKAAYRSVFAGACGVTYGHHSVWQWYAPGRDAINFPNCYWDEALERGGAAQMIHLRRLMESRPFLSRVPDQSIIASTMGGEAEQACATRSSDGSYAMIYTPTRQTLTVHPNRIAGSRVLAWWFNPRTGQAASIGDFSSSQMQAFKPPKQGDDWVLVLDNKDEGFVPPGR